jgi:hypothetical protein
MSLTVIKYGADGEPIFEEDTSSQKPVKLKRSVVRNLGRIEQIFACAERLLERTDEPHHHGAVKNA